MAKAADELRKAQRQARNRKWEDLLAFHLQVHGLARHFQREHRFFPGRQWRFDFADPVNKIAIEVQGAIWSDNRRGHNWGSGIIKDHEKYNTAAFHGWVVFQCTEKTIKNQEITKMVAMYYEQVLQVDTSPAG